MNKLFTFLLFTAFIHVGALSAIASDDEEHGGDIIYTKPLMAVMFSHENHAGEAGLDCDSCHDEIFPMEALAAEENEDFTMKSLYEGKYCGTCHDGDMAFASDTQCARCHIGVKGYNRHENKDGDSEPSKSGH